MFVGVGASRVRDLFKQAKRNLLVLFSLMKLMPLDVQEEKTMVLIQMMREKIP